MSFALFFAARQQANTWIGDCGERKECLYFREIRRSRDILIVFFFEINAKTSLSALVDIFMSPTIRLRKQINLNEENFERSDSQSTSTEFEFVHMLRAINRISNDPQNTKDFNERAK